MRGVTSSSRARSRHSSSLGQGSALRFELSHGRVRAVRKRPLSPSLSARARSADRSNAQTLRGPFLAKFQKSLGHTLEERKTRNAGVSGECCRGGRAPTSVLRRARTRSRRAPSEGSALGAAPASATSPRPTRRRRRPRRTPRPMPPASPPPPSRARPRSPPRWHTIDTAAACACVD